MQADGHKLGAGAKASLTIGALGIVFGDIGTSPLYALRECVRALPEADRGAGILGALSLVFWALMLIVCVKYLAFIMRADNRGEGGIFALLALAHTERQPKKNRPGIGAFTLLILFGAALLYGDGVITPAVTVLGAAEGLKSFNAPVTESHIVAISCVILAVLFLVQYKGTKKIGAVFGPVMLVWFIVIGAVGLWHIIAEPRVLWALNPLHGLDLLVDHPLKATAILGAVVLAITGAEALYADMGHFGRKYIAAAWFAVALPGLVLNYFGQGAYAFGHPAQIDELFFALVPVGWPRLLYVGLSIAAAIIASQALISGTYSLTRQAIQLGYFPRLKIIFTNRDQAGQIYLPLVNGALALGALYVVLTFRSSENLAAAYGIAVTGTMLVTTLAFWKVARTTWKWKAWQVIPIVTLFLTVEVAFFGSNLHKIEDGGWLPILIAVALLAIMHTWKIGKNEIFRRVYANEITEDELKNIACSDRIVRVRGTAVFMAGTPQGTPLVLLHHLKANKVLHDTVILLSVLTEEVPNVPAAERLEVREIGHGVWRAIGRYGYMESPDVSVLIQEIRAAGVPLKPNEATYYFNREMIITGGDSRMWHWEKRFYALLSRNARPVRDYYRLPPMQIIEVGLPIQL
ncbi:MAG TPA: KUP/HAK/KT family potassium transporter [Candidatus Didemnitutus sp.]|nr:KUP/HAK/KT family potassium transporter [Candidatus Didemnitutus sp.]